MAPAAESTAAKYGCTYHGVGGPAHALRSGRVLSDIERCSVRVRHRVLTPGMVKEA
jgi:hypothetical protein